MSPRREEPTGRLVGALVGAATWGLWAFGAWLLGCAVYGVASGDVEGAGWATLGAVPLSIVASIVGAVQGGIRAAREHREERERIDRIVTDREREARP